MAKFSKFPLVSIITPSYNSEKFIEETVVSVLNQDYQNIEYIVIDGRSNDGTCELLNKYLDKIEFLSEEDKGMYDAVNKGIKLSHGEYILYLNSDDLLMPNSISNLVKYMEQNDNLSMVFSDFYKVNYSGEIIERVFSHQVSFSDLLKYGNTIFSGSMLIRKRVFNDIGLFNSELKDSADYEYCLRMAKNDCIFKHIPLPLVKFRIHPKQLTNSSWNQWHEALKVNRDYGGRIYYPVYIRYFFMRFLKLLPYNITHNRNIIPIRKYFRILFKLGH